MKRSLEKRIRDAESLSRVCIQLHQELISEVERELGKHRDFYTRFAQRQLAFAHRKRHQWLRLQRYLSAALNTHAVELFKQAAANAANSCGRSSAQSADVEGKPFADTTGPTESEVAGSNPAARPSFEIHEQGGRTIVESMKCSRHVAEAVRFYFEHSSSRSMILREVAHA